MPDSRIEKVNIPDALDGLDAFWSQRTLGAANGSLIKVAKGRDKTTWHAHDDQDEVFIVYRGRLTIETRSQQVELGPGEMVVVPRGTEHRTGSPETAAFLLLGTDVTSTRVGGKPEWSFESNSEEA